MRTLTNATDFYMGSDLSVYTNGYEECAPGHSYGPAVRKSWLIHYITQGKGIFRLEDKTWHLKAGDLFLCPAGKEIFYQADEQDPWAYGWVGLQGNRVPEFLARTTLLKEPVAHYTQDDQLALIFIRTQQGYALEPGLRELRLMEMACQLLEFLICTFPDRKENIRQNDDQIVTQILSWITLHVNEPIRVEEMCRDIGISRSHASRLFTRKTGSTIKETIWNAKEREACLLLETTDLPISTIAYSVGYEDRLYFSRIFHEKTGMTPSQYRENSTQNKKAQIKTILSSEQ